MLNLRSTELGGALDDFSTLPKSANVGIVWEVWVGDPKNDLVIIEFEILNLNPNPIPKFFALLCFHGNT